MNLRGTFILVCSGIALAALGSVVWQQRVKAALAREADAVRADAEIRQDRERAVAAASDEAQETGPAPLSSEERLELMQLRSRVTELRDRQRRLGRMTGQTAELRARVQLLSNYVEGRPPPGYIRRKEARNLGAATPEAALETFLWAAEHMDTNVFLGLILNERREAVIERMQSRGAESMLKEIRSFPGLRIMGREVTGENEDVVRLEVDVGLLPGPEPWHLPFRQEDGRWKLAEF